MLLLVLPHRHEISLHDQDIGRHQYRVGKQAVFRRQALGEFVFIGVAALQQAHRRDRREQPGELRDLRQVRLQEDGRHLGVQAQGEEGRGHLQGALTQFLRLVYTGQGVIVGDEVVAVVLVLQVQVLPERAEVIAYMQGA